MSIKNVKKWMDTAEIGSSVIYYTGNLAEDRCYAGVHYDKDVAVIPNAFAEYAEDKKVDFFQKRKTKVDKSQTPKRPILDYIVRKIK
tara:strand:- start:725 stop:985 length:261 start_codon:yes stop_codon:yes gene_type:complete